MKTNQEISINVKVPEEIFKVIQQGLSFCLDFDKIFHNRDLEPDEDKRMFLQRKHDENSFKLDLIIEIIKAANTILQCLCRNNKPFQQYI